MTTRASARNGFLVARREYVERVRSRSFAVSTLILAAVALAITFVPLALRAADRGTVVRIDVHVAEPALAVAALAILDPLLNPIPRGEDPKRWEKRFALRIVDDLDVAIADARAGRSGGVIDIDRSEAGRLEFRFHTNASPSAVTAQVVNYAALGMAILDWQSAFPRTGEVPPFLGVGYDVDQLSAPAQDGRALDQQALAGRILLAMLLIAVVFITLISYAMWIATSVASEKGSRVMELLVSAASPRQLLLGKVVGVGAAGLTQYFAVALAVIAGFLSQDALSDLLLGPAPAGEASLVSVTPALVAAYGLFFLLGLGLYAFVYAAAGSLVSRAEDVQQIALPMSFVAMAGYLATAAGLAFGGLNEPWLRLLSFVPAFSPFVMLARLIAGRVEPWETALAVGLLVAAIAVTAWIAVRVYSAGVLLYGQRASLRAFVSAARVRR